MLNPPPSTSPVPSYLTSFYYCNDRHYHTQTTDQMWSISIQFNRKCECVCVCSFRLPFYIFLSFTFYLHRNILFEEYYHYCHCRKALTWQKKNTQTHTTNRTMNRNNRRLLDRFSYGLKLRVL